MQFYRPRVSRLDDVRFAKVGLCLTRRPDQFEKTARFLALSLACFHVALDQRVGAGVGPGVLAQKTIVDALGRVALLVAHFPVFLQPPVDDGLPRI
jgi:hypothetical protein